MLTTVQRNSLSVDDNIRSSIGIEHSGEGIYNCQSHNAKLFNELSILVSGKAKILTNESDYKMPYNSRADVVRLLAERYDTKSNIKLDGFRFKRPTRLATLKSCDTT